MTVPQPIELDGRILAFERPVLMGVVNVTPDSFSDGGQFVERDAAVQQAEALVAAGAEVVDIGGESTRPGAESVAAEVEMARVVPVVAELRRRNLDAVISVDTSKAKVARAALQAGATMINDVTAMGDPQMAAAVASSDAALVLMHMRGKPRTMQRGEITYEDLVGEVREELTAALERAVGAGIERHRILLDPGIGFGKTLGHNLSLTRHLGGFARDGQAVVYGPSRKRFLGAITGRPPEDRDRATAAACVAAILAGAHVLRVHNVAAVRDAVAVAVAVRDAP